jgi:cytochrome c oxidase subunit 3
MSATVVHTSAPAHHHYTALGLDSRKVAIWAFIGSECMLFVSLISTYLIYKGRSVIGPLPHEAWTDPTTGQVFKPILNIPVTSASTFVLLMSSLFMVLALAAVQNKELPKRTRGERILGSSKLWLWMTAIAGTTFLGFQAYEFTAGVLWLVTLLAIDYRRGLTSKDSLLVDISALYWHFVDVIWIVIFTLVYLIK